MNEDVSPTSFKVTGWSKALSQRGRDLKNLVFKHGDFPIAMLFFGGATKSEDK